MKDLTEIICILDKSGSMQGIKNDIIGNFNSFIETQKKEPGEAKLTLVLFNTINSTVHEALDLKDVPELTSDNYICNGGTALYDTIGQTVTIVGKRLASLEENERPSKVIVVILTDGEENSSTDYNQERIKNIITEQKNTYSWSFIFLGANQDAVLSAQGLGISKDNAMFFSNSAESANIAFMNTSSYMSRTRSMNSVQYSASLDNALADEEKDARTSN